MIRVALGMAFLRKFNRLVAWHEICLKKITILLLRFKAMRQIEEMLGSSPLAGFDVTEQDIILLWQSFKSAGLSGDAAWHAIMTGIALDMAFARTRNLPQIEQ